MKIQIIQDEAFEQTEIVIRARRIDDELAEVISCLSLIGNTVSGFSGGVLKIVPLCDVLYFESVDNKTFFYTQEDVFEIRSRLYELEEKFTQASFVRISKSCIVNFKKLKAIRRASHSRLEAELLNGEKLMVSRQYMTLIKNRLGV